MSDLFVDNIKHQSSQGSGTITLGASGETITLASGASQTMAVNTPAFAAYLSANQTGISDSTWTKVEFDTEIFDTDNCYDSTTNYRFTPTTAGKYAVYAQTFCDGGSNASVINLSNAIRKNGSEYIRTFYNYETNRPRNQNLQISGIIDMNGSSDYLEIFVYLKTSNDRIVQDGTKDTLFSAYKIIE